MLKVRYKSLITKKKTRNSWGPRLEVGPVGSDSGATDTAPPGAAQYAESDLRDR